MHEVRFFCSVSVFAFPFLFLTMKRLIFAILFRCCKLCLWRPHASLCRNQPKAPSMLLTWKPEIVLHYLSPGCHGFNPRYELLSLSLSRARAREFTCSNISSLADCRWGDQNPELCTPYTPNGIMRINCYQSSVKQVCCRTCEHIKSSIRSPVAGNGIEELRQRETTQFYM